MPEDLIDRNPLNAVRRGTNSFSGARDLPGGKLALLRPIALILVPVQVKC
jgi:hypothetical protein